MYKVCKKEFDKKDGVYVFYSTNCWTCEEHIQNLSQNISHFFLVDTSEDFNYYIEEVGIQITPTTVVYKNGNQVWKKSGMLFDKQINELVEKL